MGAVKSFRMYLLGPFSVLNLEGRQVAPRGRKACALLAMLATGPQGRRSRKWLQDRLWSDRDETQGAASLRQSLYEIRQSFGDKRDLLLADPFVIGLDLSEIWVDTDHLDTVPPSPAEPPEFLEGFDVPDDEFESWLREQRAHWHKRLQLSRQQVTVLPHRLQQSTTHPPSAGADPLLDAIVARRSEPSTGRLAVAVLPFRNRTGVGDLNYFTEGLSEDLVERLARLRWLPVIARSSSFNAPLGDLTAVSQRLSARYLVDGNVAIAGRHYIVRVELNNAEMGSVLWTSTFHLPVALTTESLEELLVEVVGRIETQIDLAEQRRAIGGNTTSSPYDELIWRGRWHMNKLTKRDAEAARGYFDRALEGNPEVPEALIQSGLWHLWRIWTGRGDKEQIREVVPSLKRAHLADTSDARGYTLLAIAQSWMHDQERAIGNLGSALEINPSLVKAHQQIGTCHYLIGEPDKAVPNLEMAIRLSPNDQHLFVCFGELAMAKLMIGQVGEAIDLATRALVARPSYWYAHLVRLVAIEGLGDHDRLESARRAYKNSGIRLTDRDFEWVPFQDSRWISKLKKQAAL